MDWTETPAITIANPGFLGNLLIQFFAARALADQIDGCTLHNFAFPEWNIDFPPVDGSLFRKTVIIRSVADFDVAYLAALARAERSLHIVIEHYLQDISLFPDCQSCRLLLPIVHPGTLEIADDELLINIRGGDVLVGHVPFYPLTPVAFFEHIVHTTQLKPVFIGQLEDGPYIHALHAAFPAARFMSSQGRIRDFDTIRRAPNIVPAISTFSVVAAWLSRARRIFLPLNGFLNPAHLRECNLLPVDDLRYRFYLFPLNHARPEIEALEFHRSLKDRWREISASQLRYIQSAAPFVKPPVPGVQSIVDEGWYLTNYLDAAMAVSEGWYADAAEHFADLGRRLGYQPREGAVQPRFPNVGLGKRAWQSSISIWSIGKTSNEDAMRAVNGDRRKAYAFHTAVEADPWWAVDLERDYRIQEIHLYNRLGPEVVRRRQLPLVIATSIDGAEWVEFARVATDDVFGAEAWPAEPKVLRNADVRRARFVKVTAQSPETCLHLAEIEIYAIP